jgi:hypothetical protein
LFSICAFVFSIVTTLSLPFEALLARLGLGAGFGTGSGAGAVALLLVALPTAPAALGGSGSSSKLITLPAFLDVRVLGMIRLYYMEDI